MGWDGQFRKLTKLAHEQGWTREVQGNGHIRFMPPNGGRPVVVSRSPSDRRAIKRVARDFRRAGLKVEPSPPLRATRTAANGAAHESFESAVQANGGSVASQPWHAPHPSEDNPEDIGLTAEDLAGPPGERGQAPEPEDAYDSYAGRPFAEALQAAREAHGLSRSEAAALMGTSYEMLSNWERGVCPQGKNMARILDCFPELRSAEVPRRRGRGPHRDGASRPADRPSGTMENEATTDAPTAADSAPQRDANADAEPLLQAVLELLRSGRLRPRVTVTISF